MLHTRRDTGTLLVAFELSRVGTRLLRTGLNNLGIFLNAGGFEDYTE